MTLRVLARAGGLAALGVIMAVLAAPAWAKAGPTRGTPYDFGLLLPAMGDPFHRAIGAGARQAGGPIDVHILTDDAWHSGITQAMQIRSFVATRADALLVDPVDPGSIRQALLRANAAHIPVVFLGQAVPGVQAAAVFRFGFAEAGQRICHILAQRLQGHGKIALLESALAAYPARQELHGCEKGLGPQTQVAIVSRQRVDPSRDGGEKGLHEVLVAHPHLDAVVAETGLMALGAIREASRLGADRHMLIAMIGSGTRREKRAVATGKVVVAAMLDPRSVGRRAVQGAFRYATKGTLGVPTATSLSVVQPPDSGG